MKKEKRIVAVTQAHIDAGEVDDGSNPIAIALTEAYAADGFQVEEVRVNPEEIHVELSKFNESISGVEEVRNINIDIEPSARQAKFLEVFEAAMDEGDDEAREKMLKKLRPFEFTMPV